ncbi:MAG: DNA mismatch repair protein MutS [Bacteroidota bacterium]|nr:DNA mismatch repair protein MutS [Bacteroidota bacterium]MDP4217617.1 DNA mismatch repair protein MutS [Bacteroidota bacterium]MDP4247751.1 DNA mismatch repair protein MutS [Bacteroidota bacterium]MDP4252809.1 DNA mismatch repair protein MutS [Bacteroidota bacterium]MDP4257716.1 DNA mismatch repair protein MutS [Bacteroidota bacterium]
MKVFPGSALVQLEFDKVRTLLAEHCQTEYARAKAEDLRVHTRLEFIELELRQAHEFKGLIAAGQYFPNDHTLNLSRELKLMSIPGAVLSGEQFMQVRRLADSMEKIFRWFDAERKIAYPALAKVIAATHYERAIIKDIDEILDESGNVRDNASEALASIRIGLYRKRNELRRAFDRILSKLAKSGYVADIEESFLNGRRVVAIFAEHKRQVKGILHGESDTRRTSFVEPEETIGLNNEVFSLEHEESREVYRILRELTGRLSAHAPLLDVWHSLLGEFDFIRAKAKLAIDINGNFPRVHDKAIVNLIQAYHPLLYLYNRKNQKPTIPTSINLNEKDRLLVISGPNAGGKTVTLKTVGLLQLMIQSGLLIPVHPDSELGIFKQLMIHIGDTQSLEFELSTYSSHLKNMKYFMENANGKTLFFIDELGSGSDPNLGGAFAEVILEELVRRHALGIVTTHYLNLKVMAGRTPGIVNAAMAFDEVNLQPLYRLIIGKPGSSYTFSIAERIGLEPGLIKRARGLVDEDHFRLDKLLNRTEQDLRNLELREKELHRLLKENEKLKKEMETLMDRERHSQQVELLKHQNKLTEDRLAYLKDMERKLKQIIFDWRKAEDKNEVIRQMQALLFKQKEQQVNEKVKKKFDSKYQEVGGDIQVGDKVMMRKNHQVGIVREIRAKRAVVQVGLVPITVGLADLTVVRDKPDIINQ